MVDEKTSVKKALIIYWSAGGNTEKVAYAIRDGLSEAGLSVTTLKTRGEELVDYYDYDLVCLGFPIYSCFIRARARSLSQSRSSLEPRR